jgi:hypothetical protein
MDTYVNNDGAGFIEVYNGGDLNSHFILEIPYIETDLDVDLIGIEGEQLGWMKFDFSNIS